MKQAVAALSTWADERHQEHQITDLPIMKQAVAALGSCGRWHEVLDWPSDEFHQETLPRCCAMTMLENQSLEYCRGHDGLPQTYHELDKWLKKTHNQKLYDVMNTSPNSTYKELLNIPLIQLMYIDVKKNNRSNSLRTNMKKLLRLNLVKCDESKGWARNQRWSLVLSTALPLGWR